MEVFRNFGRKFFGFDRQKKPEVIKEDQRSRKRQLEDDLVSKDSLNHPAKRPRMLRTDEPGGSASKSAGSETSSPVQAMFSKIKSWFSIKSKPEMVECPQGQRKIADTIQAAPPTLYSSARLDTDEVELLKVVNPKMEQVQNSTQWSDESSLLQAADKLATFAGFSTEVTGNTSNTYTPSNYSKGGLNIMTAHDKDKKRELLSPQNIRKRLHSGFRSTYDKFYHEKDITRRIGHGSIKKKPKQNAFEYSAALADRSRYKALIERYSGTSMIKFNAWTNKTSMYENKVDSTHNLQGGESLSGAARVTDVDATKMVTSTVIKPRLTSTTIKNQSNLANVRVEASPVVLRDIKDTSSTTPASSNRKVVYTLSSPHASPAPGVKTPSNSKEESSPLNSLEQELACEEVYSPAFLPKLWDKYGAVAREREKQILREEERKKKCEKDIDELYTSIDKRLESHLKITQVALPEVEIDEGGDDLDQPTELAELTSHMREVIQRAERSRGEVLVDAHKIQITVRDINTLKGLQWLNDEVINFYMQMIVTRSGKGKLPSVYACTTFFYPKLKDGGHASVKRWTKKVDIFAHDIVLVPVHLGMHWCLATIDMQRKKITYYDSMGGNNHGCLKALFEYIKEEHLVKKGVPIDESKWNMVIAKEIPQQMNGSDCGMFTCKFAEYISRRARFTFTQRDMPYFRQRMVYEIVKNNLIHP